MKLLKLTALFSLMMLASNLLIGCGRRAKMERCKFVEIE